MRAVLEHLLHLRLKIGLQTSRVGSVIDDHWKLSKIVIMASPPVSTPSLFGSLSKTSFIICDDRLISTSPTPNNSHKKKSRSRSQNQKAKEERKIDSTSQVSHQGVKWGHGPPPGTHTHTIISLLVIILYITASDLYLDTKGGKKQRIW